MFWAELNHLSHFSRNDATNITIRGCTQAVNQKANHSALMRNLTKVWKTWTGPLRGGRAWSRGPKSALSEILQYEEHYH